MAYIGDVDQDAQARYESMENVLLELERANGRASVLYKNKVTNSSTVTYWRASYPEFKARWDALARNQFKRPNSVRQYGEIKSPELMAKILEGLAAGKSITYAARAAGVSRGAALKWKHADVEFAEAWEEALVEGKENLEDEAHRRARDGTLKPVFHQGEQCGVIREYSDALMQLLLRARDPEKYKDFKQVHNHFTMGNSPLKVLHVRPDDLAKLSTLELAKLYRETITSIDGNGKQSSSDSN